MRTDNLIKIAGFAAILLVLIDIEVSLAAVVKLKQSGSKLCYSCHEEEKSSFDKKYVHSPIQKDNCIVCHNPHTAKYQFMLVEKDAALCYACHVDERERFSQAPYIHTAVKQEKCIGCHNPHASDNEHLQERTGEELCYSCHQKKAEDFAKGKVHPLVKAGRCLVCHDPHASTYKAHLRNSPEQLCFDCHNQRDEGFITICQTHSQYPVSKSDCLICHSAHAVYVHEPFVEDTCDSCHVSSDSPEPFKLKLTYTELCYSCHKDMQKEVSNQDYVHILVKEGRCASCHASHAAENEHLLVVPEKKLCVNNCHLDVTNKLKAKYPHNPAEPISCLKCHKPHDSENESLLVDDSTAMCVSCHEKEKTFTHPLGEAAIDPHTQEGMTCVTCHDAHGSEYEFVLLADRQRDLCIQCHKR